ncbi:Triosephosphate isomerase [Dissostichus eleginoides]|uniref:Triosephosphate isomerase n=1 Tax=Dissostichus eleginoides TaxID=100907 RepID=A0AAD9CR38_DISEL|nr:Triosephosphate isomerase [Dissostichus eleginoides]
MGKSDCLLRYPIRRSGFSNGIQSVSSPGNGKWSSRVSERSERRSKVLLNGDAPGSLLQFIFSCAGIAL